MIRAVLLLFLLILTSVVRSQNYPSESLEEVLYKRGLDLIDGGNLTSARQSFEDYINLYPEGELIPEAKYYIARCALKLYNRDGELLIKEFITEYSAHPKAASAYYELGKFYFKSKNYPLTTKYLKLADLSLLSITKKNETLFMLGYGFFNQKKFDDALTYFNQLKLTKNDYTASASYYGGFIEFERELYELAINDFMKIEKDEEFSKEVTYMIAGSYYKSGNYEEALKYTLPKLNDKSNYSNQHLLTLAVAESYYYTNQYTSAIEYYEDYKNAVRNSIEPEIRYRMAYSYYLSQQKENALDNFKIVANEAQELGVYASYYMGTLYLEADNKRYALAAFDKVSQNDFNQDLKEEGLYLYAKVQYDIGSPGGGIQSMENYLNNYPNGKYHNEVSELLSTAYLSSNDYKRALNYIEGLSRRSAKIDQAYQKAAFYLGTEYFNKRDYRRAVDMFAKSLSKPFDKNFVIMANYWTAEAYSIGLRWDEAKRYYNNIITNKSNINHELYFPARYGLGYAYFNTKEYYRARIQFREYVISNMVTKYKGDAFVRLADCYYVEKDYENAISYYNEALKINKPDADYINLHLGLIEMLRDNFQMADGYFNKVISKGLVSQYYDNALFQQAQLYFNKSKYKESVTVFSKLIDEKPKSRFVPNGLMRRASAYYNLGDYETAVGDYKRLLEDYSRHKLASDALLPLQDVLTLLNRSSEFDGYLAAYKEANPERTGLEEVEFESLKNKYFNQEYAYAIEGFNKFIKDYPNDPRGIEARYYIADSYFRLDDKAKSKDIFTALLENVSFWKYPSVVEKVADLEFEFLEFEKAIKHYNELSQIAENKRQQNIAMTGTMLSYYNLGKYDSSIVYAQKVLQSASINVSSQNKASLFLGKSYFSKGNYEKAKDEFLNTINSAKDVSGAEAQYLLGEVFYLQKKYKQSIEVLIDLNTNFQTFQHWVGKGFLLISDNYIGLNDFFQARGTLNSLIKHFPDEAVKDQAKNKLKSIDSLEAEQKVQDSIRREKALRDSTVVTPKDTVKNEN